MTFPLPIEILGFRIHPHILFEGLGYFIGARWYFATSKGSRDPVMPLEARLWLLIGCIFGAWAGSKLLAWVESPTRYLPSLQSVDWHLLMGGKTIAGGLLGGWAGIEIAKKALGIRASTGDRFVWPLAIGTALGRLGCFFTGLADQTYGIATSLPWGVDFGDGIARHPTQLYESIAVLTLALLATRIARAESHPAGTRFRLYFAGYFLWRLLVEFIKPRELLIPPLHLSAIQCASLLGLALSLLSLRRLRASS